MLIIVLEGCLIGVFMRKIIAIWLLIIMTFSLGACDEHTQDSVWITHNKTHYLSTSYEGFLSQLEKHGKEVGEDFFVLAPQDYSEIPKWELYTHYKYEIEKTDYEMDEAYVCQSFYVCNEEKYGRQLTDWGQYSGIGINFEITFISNALYLPEIDEAVTINHLNVTAGDQNSNYVDLYQGQTCFASMIFKFWKNVPSNVNRKNYLENYIKDNVMPYTEYLMRNENGEFKQAPEVEKREVPKGESAYVALSGEIDYTDNDVTELAQHNLPILYIDIFSNDLKGICKSVDTLALYVGQKALDKEKYFKSVLSVYIEELGGFWISPTSTNIDIYLMAIPIYIDEFDVNLVSLDQVNEGVANLYYDGFCCGTVSYKINGNLYDATSEEKDEYLENFLKTYLRYYNPNEEVEQAN